MGLVSLQTKSRRTKPPSDEACSPSEKTAAKDGQAKPAMTDRQMRALSRKHLFMMIRDQEKELAQLKKEKADILLAFRAGVEYQTEIQESGLSYTIEPFE